MQKLYCKTNVELLLKNNKNALRAYLLKLLVREVSEVTSCL